MSEIVCRRLDPAVLRWVWLNLIAMAELTWLAIRIEAPPSGILSYTKEFPSIFITSLAVLTLLGWAGARGRLLSFPTFQNFSPNPWPRLLAHVGAFAAFFWLTGNALLLVSGLGAAPRPRPPKSLKTRKPLLL